MMFPDRTPLDEIAALHLPYPQEVIINHGAALVARGIRLEHENGDIDVVTNLENNLYLESELGFRAVQMVVGTDSLGNDKTIISLRDDDNRFDVQRWDFSIHRHNHTGKGRIYLTELAAMSDQDPETGIWVAKPELVLLTKLDTGRPKDQIDVELIRRHLAKQ